jgi:hypothetical protein
MAQQAASKASPEQVRYADLLFYGCWIGIFLMLITYLIYVMGIMEAYIPIEKVPTYWGMPVGDYLHAANVPHGWGWVGLLSKGDFLNFIGIALLAGMTIVCYFTLIPVYAKQKDTPLLIIVILEVIVLCVAASGILGAAGH